MTKISDELDELMKTSLYKTPSPKKPSYGPPKLPHTPLTNIRNEARAGNHQAQYDLAVRYQLGKGVEKDDIAAYKWYTVAAGNSNADEKLKNRVAFNKKTLIKRMTGEQIKEAEIAAKNKK